MRSSPTRRWERSAECCERRSACTTRREGSRLAVGPIAYGLGGKTALVTGAGQGIGQEVARRLAAEGVAVAVNGRDAGKLAAVVSEIQASGGHAMAAAAHVESRQQVTAMVELVLSSLGRIDLLVNNAGISMPDAFIDLSE